MARAPNQATSRALWMAASKMGLLGLAGIKTGQAGWMVPAYAASLAGQTGRGARWLTGQGSAQKYFTNAFDSPVTDDVTFGNLLRTFRDNAANQGASFTGN